MNALRRHRALVFAAYGVLLVLGWWLAMQWKSFDADLFASMDAALTTRVLIIALLLFMLTSALPFVPGVEIGFALLVLFGGTVALLVYGAMVLALSAAYLVGATVPPALIARFLAYMGLKKASDLVVDLAGKEYDQRLDFLLANAPKGWVPMLLKRRYLAFALALNTPGNSFVGGGGGLALAAGMSGLFRFPRFLVMLMVAIAPVPLIFHFTV